MAANKLLQQGDHQYVNMYVLLDKQTDRHRTDINGEMDSLRNASDCGVWKRFIFVFMIATRRASILFWTSSVRLTVLIKGALHSLLSIISYLGNGRAHVFVFIFQSFRQTASQPASTRLCFGLLHKLTVRTYFTTVLGRRLGPVRNPFKWHE